MEDVRPDLPSGTAGPFVFDDQGNVAMATIAIIAEGFENHEMREAAKELRRIIYANVPGVRKIDFSGVEEQRVYVEFDNIRISQIGIDPNAIISSTTRQNVILPGGRVEADGMTMTIEPTGDFDGLDDISSLSVRIDGDPPTTIYLRDIANVRLGYAEPAEKPAVVVGVSMIDQVGSKAFSAALKDVVRRYQHGLPWGFELDFIPLQQNEIDNAVSSVLNNLWQTCLIVLLVVIAFLGLRTGLIVGAMVLLVMLISTLVMRQAGVELERISLAALIISLGLLVDNGIVVVEDMQGRSQSGQQRIKAGIESGRALILSLLAASLTTILAFMPLMLAPGAAGEYTRSIALVIAIALALSWVAALTILLLVCIWFMKAGAPQDENAAMVDDITTHIAECCEAPSDFAGWCCSRQLVFGLRWVDVSVSRQDFLSSVRARATAGDRRAAGRREHHGYG
jgi:multidrug efflux pump subunit AcrB